MSESRDRPLPVIPHGPSGSGPEAAKGAEKARRRDRGAGVKPAVGADRPAADRPPPPGLDRSPGEVGTSGTASSKLSRRAALKILAAATAAPVLAAEACEPEASVPASGAAATSNPRAHGTPADPDLVTPTVPWDGVLTDDEMQTVRALCDLILPGDDRSPAASAVGVPEFIDEWISAPYPSHERERVLIRGGLVWLDTEAGGLFGEPFAALTEEQQRQICDRIRYVPDAAPADRPAALFFDRFRDLTSSGYWTTEEGMADLGYRGNVPMPTWDGPPPEVLERLGLA